MSDSGLKAAVQHAESITDPNPTPERAKAGEYRKGSLTIHGMKVVIENARGSTRSGIGPNGKKWSVKMPATYGYVDRTIGVDGDEVDVYIGPNPSSDIVYVIDQIDADSGVFDEHKAMLGYDSIDEALADYDAAFDDGRGPDRRGAVTTMCIQTFRDWMREGTADRPAALFSVAGGGQVNTASDASQ